jgi:hypothetical protein
MGKQWRDAGQGGSLVDAIVDSVTGGGGEKGGVLGDTRTVQDTKTGEYREVHRGWGQTTGEAIEKGQFKEKA